MTAFAAMVGALFADPNMTVEAAWQGGFGASATVRGILRQGDEVVDFGGARLSSAVRVLDVRLSDLPDARKADLVEIAGTTWRIAADPVADAEGLVVRLMLKPEL